jgi:hypothetical protein
MSELKVITKEVDIFLSVMNKKSAKRLYKKVRDKFPVANIDVEVFTAESGEDCLSNSEKYDFHFAGMPDGTIYQLGGKMRFKDAA